MSHNIMPMAKLLSRKLLPLKKPRGRVRAGRKPLQSMGSGRIEKTSPLTKLKTSRRLSPRESQLAEALANIKDNYQRPDNALIEAMRKKHRLKTPTAEQEEPPAEPSQPSSAVVDSDPIIMAKPAPIVVSSPSQTINASTLEPPKKTEGWEEEAKRIIDQQNLSLDRGWSKFTWKQKASNVVRLKLLKDDGYDTAPLQVKGISADRIIDALLAHVDARTQLVPAQNVSSTRDTDAQSEASGDSEESELTDKQDEEGFAVGSGETMIVDSTPHGSDAKYHTIIRPQPRISPEGMFYTTVPLFSQKRKHNHDDDDLSDWHERLPQPHLHNMYNEMRPQRDSLSAVRLSLHSHTCGRPISGPKRPCLLTPNEMGTVIDSQAHEVVKKRISRRIFKTSRAARKVFQVRSSSDGKSSSAPELVLTSVKPPKPSRVVFTQACTPATQPSDGHVYMGSVGFDLIEEEIKSLSSRRDEDGRHCIHDPESGEDMDRDLLMEYNGPVYRAFRHDVRMTSGENQSIVIEGDPRALVSLVQHLRKQQLHHLCRYLPMDIEVDVYGERDIEMKVLKNYSIPFHLSEAVCGVLEKVQRKLREAQDVGGTEVRVGVVPQRAMYRVH